MIKSTTTQNGALSCETSGSSRLNLFYRTVRGVSTLVLFELLEKSWQENPLDTLKLIFYTRDCRGGKGERQLFYDCLDWLISHHPNDLLVNLELIPEFGRWEDLLRFIDVEECGIGMAIAKMFASQLKRDLEMMQRGQPVTLCAKWAPTEKCKYDKKCSAVKLICNQMGIKMNTYRKDYLSPLRAYIQVVERYISLGNWNLVDYSKVPGHCMRKLKRAFCRNDSERFQEYQSKLSRGETKINASTIEPHEIVGEYLKGAESSVILDAQWNEIVKRVKDLGTMDRALALVDVSGSMSGRPITVSISLGLIISELSMPPFRGKMITFSEEPQMCSIDMNAPLRDRVAQTKDLDWGGSTNFFKVFMLILQEAVRNNLSQDEMPTSLYVISDMQFDMADGGSSMTNLGLLKMCYMSSGYEMPKLIFWNVNGGFNDYVTDDLYEGSVATISGFSTSLLKLILEGEDFSPMGILLKLFEDERYSKVKHYDELDQDMLLTNFPTLNEVNKKF